MIAGSRGWLGIALCAGIGATGCDEAALSGEGGVYDEARDLSGFHGIETDGINVQARRGTHWSVTVRTDDNLHPHVRARLTGADDGILSLSLEEGVTAYPTVLEVLVTAPSLDTLRQRGGADLIAENLAEDSLHVEASGDGHTELTGEVAALWLASEGSGVRNAQLLRAEDAEVDLAGSGEAWLTVTDTLSGQVAGEGVLNVFGDPKHREVEADGPGTVVYR